MKLNIGCSEATGIYKRGGWINLDLIRHDRMNLIGSGLALPFRDNCIDEIHCIHVLEHVTRDKSTPMLKEMYRVLKPGCSAFVEVPDFEETVRCLEIAFRSQDRTAIHQWTTSIYGKNERPGMAHFAGFSSDLLEKKMRLAGFEQSRRFWEDSEMISSHYKQEPVILMKATKS